MMRQSHCVEQVR